uniref:Putative ovule protein n=1 Tax=Solanum chacoense TaxID=4108 RepID=A0A0V0ICB6_SOLCH
MEEMNSAQWLVGGDFNVILDESEKLGGLPVTQQEVEDFAQCINNCALTEIQFTGSLYTWWNGRIEEGCIFKRLDRVFGSIEFTQEFAQSEVQHLIREGFDHAPLHVLCRSMNVPAKKPFRFLNFWTKHYNFKGVVEKVWGENIIGSPFSCI